MRSHLFQTVLVSVIVSLGVGYAFGGRAPDPFTATHFLFLADGTCPAGWVQETSYDGYYLRSTIAAHSNVGSTGGSATLTATGTVSQPTFTGNAVTSSAVSAGTPAGTVSQPTVTMDSYTPAGTNGTVSFTPAGTNGTGTVTATGTIAWPAGVPTISGTTINSVSPTINSQGTIAWPVAVPTHSGTTINAVTTTSGSFKGTSSGGFSAIGGAAPGSSFTPTINSQGTIAWPASVPTHSGTTINSFTPTINAAGTIAWPAGVPTFSGTSATTSAQTFTGSSGTVPAETFTGSAHVLTGTVSQPTFSGSALGTHTHTTTATGTVSQPTFTGDAVTNAPSYVNLILCKPASPGPAAVPAPDVRPDVAAPASQPAKREDGYVGR